MLQKTVVHRRDELCRHEDGVLHLVLLGPLDPPQVVVLDHLQDEVGQWVVRHRRVLVLVVIG